MLRKGGAGASRDDGSLCPGSLLRLLLFLFLSVLLLFFLLFFFFFFYFYFSFFFSFFFFFFFCCFFFLIPHLTHPATPHPTSQQHWHNTLSSSLAQHSINLITPPNKMQVGQTCNQGDRVQVKKIRDGSITKDTHKESINVQQN